jgi:hypothetical protein
MCSRSKLRWTSNRLTMAAKSDLTSLFYEDRTSRNGIGS